MSKRLSLLSLFVCLAMLAALTLGASGTVASPTLTPQLFWSNQVTQSIESANLDGTGVNASFITGQNFPGGIALDGQHIYWANAGAQEISRANLDGSSPTAAFITGVSDGSNGVAVDAGHVYWANEFNRVIGRANLDGSGVNQSFIPVTVSRPFSVEADASHIYWTNFDTNAIGRANIDGSGANQNFITGLDGPGGLAVDGSHIYWTNETGDTIGRANLDGSGVDENFITGAAFPAGVVAGAGHIYWTNLHAQTIGRANIDGSSVDQSFITNTAAVGLALQSVPDAPTAVSAVAANSQASVSFTAPPSNGAPITSYTVTASPGGVTASASASPITVTGLTNGTAYTFTVTATNGVGTGAASAASNSVTPTVPPAIVTNTNDSGAGSLRQAMAQANTAPGTTIEFQIPESDPGFNGQWFTIAPLSLLPALTTNGTTIDGATQTAFTGDTNPAGPEVFLDGRTMTFGGSGTPGGLLVQGSSIVVEGLTVSGFAGENITVDGGNGAVLSGDDIGTDPTGSSAIVPPSDSRVFEDDGIQIIGGAIGTRVGGTTAAERDVISGNQGSGVLVTDNSNGQVIEGDYVGTDATGEAALANAGWGIAITPYGGFDESPTNPAFTISGNLVSGDNGGLLAGVGGVTIRANLVGTNAGGTAAVPNTGDGVTIGDDAANAIVSGNVISGNEGRGIDLWGTGSTAVTINGNLIGTDDTGTAALPNTGDGIDIEQGASANSVSSNTIADNGGSGVGVLSGTHDRITRNSVYGNGGLGIDLGGDGVTANDAGDLDTGPNNLQNFPVLTSAVNPNGHVTITGTIDTQSPHAVVIEIYAAGGDASGYGEGAVFLGTATPTTGGTFSVTLPAVAPGTLISATATDAAGDTSEFARDIVVTGAAPVNTVAPTITGTATVGQTLTAAHGTWTGTAPIGYTYQWEQCDSGGNGCSPVSSGGTSVHYTVQNTDLGHTLVVDVTASNLTGTAAAASVATAVVTGTAPVNTAVPTVTGTVAVGQSLTGTRGTWTGLPTSYAYQWELCDSGGANCVAEPSGGGGARYTIRNSDAGHTLVLQVTATSASGATSASSAATAVVPGVPPANTAAPTATGTLAVGKVLTGSRGSWTGSTPITYVYSWLRCDTGGSNCLATGAHGLNYTLRSADLGHTMELQVTATNGAGSIPATSAATAVVHS